jgi:hypothetical protein
MSFSFTWTIHYALRSIPNMCKEKTITETVHDGKPVMRDQDGNLVVIINSGNRDEDVYDEGWSTNTNMRLFKEITKEQRYFLATHPSLVRLVAEYYQTYKLDKVKLIDIIQDSFPMCDKNEIKLYINYHTENLCLQFVPPHSKFIINYTGTREFVVVYDEDRFYSS